MTARGTPGRSRRLWLESRLQRARRAVDLLDRKRQVLSVEDRRLEAAVARVAADWEAADREARRWAARAEAIGGSWTVSLVAAQVGGRADARVVRCRTAGVDHPGEVSVVLPEPPLALSAATGSLAGWAGAAHRHALERAAAFAVTEEAYRLVHRELKTTERRQRAIERIRIPELEQEWRDVVLRLDELERDERVVSRWAARDRTRDFLP